jgi:hypothetical protein
VKVAVEHSDGYSLMDDGSYPGTKNRHPCIYCSQEDRDEIFKLAKRRGVPIPSLIKFVLSHKIKYSAAQSNIVKADRRMLAEMANASGMYKYDFLHALLSDAYKKFKEHTPSSDNDIPEVVKEFGKLFDDARAKAALDKAQSNLDGFKDIFEFFSQDPKEQEKKV